MKVRELVVRIGFAFAFSFLLRCAIAEKEEFLLASSTLAGVGFLFEFVFSYVQLALGALRLSYRSAGEGSVSICFSTVLHSPLVHSLHLLSVVCYFSVLVSVLFVFQRFSLYIAFLL